MEKENSLSGTLSSGERFADQIMSEPEQSYDGDICEAEQPAYERRNADRLANSKPKSIVITALDYGYEVQVGCQKFAIEDSGRMLDMLKLYLKNPGSVEKKWTTEKSLPWIG
jgi:hypothetical protein